MLDTTEQTSQTGRNADLALSFSERNLAGSVAANMELYSIAPFVTSSQNSYVILSEK